MRGFMGGVRSVRADLQSAVVEYQDLQSDYACFPFTLTGFIGILFFVGGVHTVLSAGVHTACLSSVVTP